jgi:hypothetical protein
VNGRLPVPGCEVERVEVPEGIGPQDQYRLTIRSLSDLPLDALVPETGGGRYLATIAGDRLITLDGSYLVTI